MSKAGVLILLFAVVEACGSSGPSVDGGASNMAADAPGSAGQGGSGGGAGGAGVGGASSGDPCQSGDTATMGRMSCSEAWTLKFGPMTTDHFCEELTVTGTDPTSAIAAAFQTCQKGPQGGDFTYVTKASCDPCPTAGRKASCKSCIRGGGFERCTVRTAYEDDGVGLVQLYCVTGEFVDYRAGNPDGG